MVAARGSEEVTDIKEDQERRGYEILQDQF